MDELLFTCSTQPVYFWSFFNVAGPPGPHHHPPFFSLPVFSCILEGRPVLDNIIVEPYLLHDDSFFYPGLPSSC